MARVGHIGRCIQPIRCFAGRDLRPQPTLARGAVGTFGSRGRCRRSTLGFARRFRLGGLARLCRGIGGRRVSGRTQGGYRIAPRRVLAPRTSPRASRGHSERKAGQVHCAHTPNSPRACPIFTRRIPQIHPAHTANSPRAYREPCIAEDVIWQELAPISKPLLGTPLAGWQLPLWRDRPNRLQ